MNLELFKNLELDQRVKILWKKEREILHELLLTLKEIEARRCYLEMGYSSLFEYLVHEIKCDGGTAQRRIDAVRLMMDVPLVAEKIQSGEMSLNKISMIQQACREVKKSRDAVVTAKEKKELVESIIDKDFRSAQREIAQYFDMPVVQTTVKKIQADESVRVELTLSKELYEKIQEAQALLSHALGTNDLVTYLSFVTDKVIKQKTSVRNLRSKNVDLAVAESASDSVKVEPSTKEALRKSDFARDNPLTLETLKPGNQPFTSARNESAHHDQEPT